MNEITIERIKNCSDELAVGIGKLMPALSSKMTDAPTERQTIENIVSSPNHELFVAYDGDNVVGVAVLSIVMGIDIGHNAYLESFVVDPNTQGKGIGSIVWDDMISWCKEKGCHKLEFTSNPKRVGAIAFYQKKGATIYDTNFFQYKLS